MHINEKKLKLIFANQATTLFPEKTKEGSDIA